MLTKNLTPDTQTLVVCDACSNIYIYAYKYLHVYVDHHMTICSFFMQGESLLLEACESGDLDKIQYLYKYGGSKYLQLAIGTHPDEVPEVLICSFPTLFFSLPLLSIFICVHFFIQMLMSADGKLGLVCSL
jgi:hypothetical protein